MYLRARPFAKHVKPSVCVHVRRFFNFPLSLLPFVRISPSTFSANIMRFFFRGYVITSVEMEHLYVPRINNSNSVCNTRERTSARVRFRARALYSLQTLNEVDNWNH